MSKIVILFKGEPLRKLLQDIDRDSVIAFLQENPDLIVVRNPTASSKKSKADGVVIASGMMKNGKIEHVIYNADDVKIIDLNERFPNKDKVVSRLSAPEPGSSNHNYTNKNAEPGSSNNSNVEPGSNNNAQPGSAAAGTGGKRSSLRKGTKRRGHGKHRAKKQKKTMKGKKRN
jgi:hypothetical protein